MNTVTIRNIEDETKQALKVQAAKNGVSLEEELRTILRREARQPQKKQPEFDNLYDAIRELVEPHGGLEIKVPERSHPSRPLPFEDWE